MNKSLLAFAVIIIFGGIFLGIPILAVFGAILLLPALLTTPKEASKVPVSKAPSPQPRRITAAPASQPSQSVKMEYSGPGAAQPQAPAPMPTTMYAPSAGSMSSGVIYSPALFPNSMFPSFSAPASYRPQLPEHKEGRVSETDELLEFGLLIAVLRLVSS